jgi:hypothetical protein
MELNRFAKEGLEVFRGNYVLAIPTVLSVFAVSFLSLAFVKSPQDTKGLVAMGLVSMVFSYFSHGITIGMALEAIEKGKTSLRTGGMLATRLFSRFILASVLIGMIVSAGFMLFIFPGLAAAFFLLFVFPAIVVDGSDGVASLRHSYRTVFSNLRDSLMLFAFIVVVGLLFGIANIAVSSIQVVGQLLGVVFSGIFGGYISVVILKVYMSFKEEAQQQA